MIYRDTYAYVYLDNIKHNIEQMKRLLSSNINIMAVLKSDAYGHGIIETADEVISQGINFIAVATLVEGLIIRKRHKAINILILGYTPKEYIDKALENDIALTIFSTHSYEELIEVSKKYRIKPKIHIKIDTGFNSLGFKIDKTTIDIIKKIHGENSVHIEGIYSHFALKDYGSDKKQFELFEELLREIDQWGIHIPYKHICDSISAVVYPQYHLNMVRLGAVLYGLKSSRPQYDSLNLKMSLKLVSRISHIKTIEKDEGISYDYTFIAKSTMKIATLPIGYADGVPRELSNKGYVTIRGKKAPIVGKICMDQMMVDITAIEDVSIRDEAAIFFDGSDETLSIDQAANLCGTNKNEILTRISPRVSKIYIKDNILFKTRIPILEGFN